LASKKNLETQKRANQRELVWCELVKAKRIDEDPNFEGSELVEDQSPCAKKLFSMEINHILRSWLDTSASLVFFGQKWPFSKSLHQGLIFTDLKDFLYSVYWDQDQQFRHTENAGNSI
jgi:hypothetical protein